MGDRNFSLAEYWKHRFADTTPQLRVPLDDINAYTRWRVQAEAKYKELMGRLPEPVPLEPEVTESVDCGSYVRQRVVLQVEQDMAMPCYLLVPKDRSEPGPAVLAQHGHGNGKSDVCNVDDGDLEKRKTINDLNYDYGHQLALRGYVVIAPDLRSFGERLDEEKRKTINDLNYDYGHQLALRGYVVIAPDLRSFGERLDETPDYLSACDFNYVMGAMLGYNLLALDIWDLQRAIDYLQQHPLVDPERIGMTGLSQGGTMTLFTTAYEPRIKVAVCSGYFNSWWGFPLLPWNMCGSQMLFDVVNWFDHLELAALIAPRPLLIEIGTNDPIFPVDVTVREFEKLSQLYETLGVRERLDIDVFDGGHEYSGAKAYDWFDKWL